MSPSPLNARGSPALSAVWKSIKYFVDSTLRDKVVPLPGSVLYCDLWVAVEHSGVYVGDGEISNIVVNGLAESTVLRSTPESFTSKSILGRQIYVSCDRNGAVGDPLVAAGASRHVGEQSFYGLAFKNCHAFSSRCVGYAGDRDLPVVYRVFPATHAETWEPTLKALKATARHKLGTTKWRLWDWQADGNREAPREPDWEGLADALRQQSLDAETISQIANDLAQTREYEGEIADEDIPDNVRQHITAFRTTLEDISRKYEEAKPFLSMFPAAKFSYAEMQACHEDFTALAQLLQENVQIEELTRRLGRNHISEEQKKQAKVPQASRSEVHGTHRSDDVMRMLPSELVNLEDETLEVLFYARLLEQNLLSYELRGKTWGNGEKTEAQEKRTGPVIACLDTSGSMKGAPLLKAKALLLAISRILKREARSLHVILFGSTGEIREFSMEGDADVPGLLRFLSLGFGAGTDFETPLSRAFDVIAAQPGYRKADVLMISDGDCQLSPAFIETLRNEKERLNFMVYSVLCAGSRRKDAFSDEVMVL